MRLRAKVGLIASALLIVGAPALWACEYSPIVKDTPASFTVVVRDRRTPLAGMKVAIDRYADREKLGKLSEVTGTTDSNGYARFEHLPEGRYHVRVDLPNGTEEDIHVVPKIVDPKYAIWLKWPDLEILTARKAAGTMRIMCGSDDCPLSTNLSLIRATTSEKIKTVSINGSFDFGDVAPGLYFIRVQPATQENKKHDPEGDIAIEIDRAATDQDLQIDVGTPVCGIFYSGRCTVEPVSMFGLCGVVSDLSNGVISDASIRVEDRNTGRIVATALTDRNGEFDLNNEVPEGGYIVSFLSPGFTPSRVPVRLFRGNFCGVNKLHVQMVFLGSCGKVEVSGSRN